MRLLADENVPLKAVQLLWEKGHDVLSISESMPYTADRRQWTSSNPNEERRITLVDLLFEYIHWAIW
jgi:hypothetical protein